MGFFRRNATLEKELRGQLSTAEEKIQALQTEEQKEREEKAVLERALQEAKDTSRSIQDEMDQRTARLQAELEMSKQTGEDALDEKEKQVQKLQEHMLKLQEEKAKFQKIMKETTQRMVMVYAQKEYIIKVFQKTLSEERNTNQGLQEEVCRLQRERDEANNTSRNLQKKTELQNQLNKKQSEDLEKSRGLHEEVSALQEQIQAQTTACERSEEQAKKYAEEKMEERERSKELEKAIHRLENIIGRYRIEKKAMAEDFQTVKEAAVNMEQSMEEQMNQLQHELDLKEEQNKQLERDLSSTQKELEEQNEKHLEMVQNMKETYEKEERERNQEKKVTLKENNRTISFKDQMIIEHKEEVQTLKETNSHLEEKILSLQEEVQALKERDLDHKTLTEEVCQSHTVETPQAAQVPTQKPEQGSSSICPTENEHGADDAPKDEGSTNASAEVQTSEKKQRNRRRKQKLSLQTYLIRQERQGTRSNEKKPPKPTALTSEQEDTKPIVRSDAEIPDEPKEALMRPPGTQQREPSSLPSATEAEDSVWFELPDEEPEDETEHDQIYSGQLT